MTNNEFRITNAEYRIFNLVYVLSDTLSDKLVSQNQFKKMMNNEFRMTNALLVKICNLDFYKFGFKIRTYKSPNCKFGLTEEFLTTKALRHKVLYFNHRQD